ncbi:hypothetical protein PRUPE_2G263100, partial [Prunus persica]
TLPLEIKLTRTNTTRNFSQKAEKSGPLAHIPDIKLIRTDTTLDLSQKAEKGMSSSMSGNLFHINSPSLSFLHLSMWDTTTFFSLVVKFLLLILTYRQIPKIG